MELPTDARPPLFVGLSREGAPTREFVSSRAAGEARWGPGLGDERRL